MFIGMTTTSDISATDWPESDSATGVDGADLGTDGEDDTDSGSASSNNGSTAAPASGRSKTARPTRVNDRAQRALVRRAAEKAVEITHANPEHRKMLAKLLGIDDDIVAITVAAVVGSTVAVADDLFSLVDADPMEAGIMAAELAADKARAKALWTLLVSVKAAKGEMPVGSGRAGLAMARAAKGLDKGVREEINSALALLS